MTEQPATDRKSTPMERLKMKSIDLTGTPMYRWYREGRDVAMDAAEYIRGPTAATAKARLLDADSQNPNLESKWFD